MQLWILASENDGKIEYDIDEIKFRLRDESIKIEDVKALLDKGFLRICKQTLADDNKCLPETETETETDISTLTGTCPQSVDDGTLDPPKPEPPKKPEIPPCPHQEIIKLYHDILPELRHVKTWNENRRKLLRTRWKEDPKHRDFGFWERYFEYVKKCPFLMGKISSKNGSPPFEADLEWLVRPQNFARVIEGKYERGRIDL
jgi:hypothetical protein